MVAAGRTRNILDSSFLSLWLKKNSSQRRTAPVKLSKKIGCELGTVFSFSKFAFNIEKVRSSMPLRLSARQGSEKSERYTC